MSSEGGFDFSLCKRNAMLELKGAQGPKPWKTGTTIAGVVYKVRCVCEDTPEAPRMPREKDLVLPRRRKRMHLIVHAPLTHRMAWCLGQTPDPPRGPP